MSEIVIPENDRVFVTGMTGSGKTHFSKKALAETDRLVVFDIKNNLRQEMNLERWSKSALRQFVKGLPIRLQITAPARKGINEPDWYNEKFGLIYGVGNTRVFIDEMLGVLKNAVDLPYWLKAIYTRGREPITRRGRVIGGNIGVVAATQRPSHIPVFCMTESEHFFIFHLQNPDDRKKVSLYTTPEVALPVAHEHGFYYYNNRDRKAIYVPRL